MPGWQRTDQATYASACLEKHKTVAFGLEPLLAAKSRAVCTQSRLRFS